MANLIQMKRSATPTKVPTVLDLELGEFAINTFDGKVFIKKDNGTESIVEVGVRGGTAVQNVFYVSKSGDDLYDGKSLDQSKKTIRSAVEATRLTHATATASVNAGGVSSITVVNAGAGYITSLTANGFASKTGSGPFLVTINFPAQESSPPTNVMYRVVGNATAGYNGTFLCTASTLNSITLSYPTDPGSWGGGTTTITISPLFLRPTVTIFGDGTGATASATVLDGQVKNITVTNPGTGYTTASVVISQSPTNSVIFVKSGDYTEINPIFVPAGVSIVGDSLRTTSVRPATQSNDIFWVNSKSYFTEMTFRSHIGNVEPYPAAFSFPRYFISSVSKTSPVRVKLGFNYDRAKCSRDVGLIVDAVALDLKFPTAENSQTTFAGIQYWNQTESAIPGEENATVATYKFLREVAARVVLEDTSVTPYQGVVTQDTSGTAASSAEANIIRDEFNLIIDIIENGTVGVTDKIVPNGITASVVSNVTNAYAQLQANKAFMKAEATAFIGTVFPDLTYDTVKCERDVGYLVDSICFDLLYGGNKQAVQSGTYYYGYNNSGNFVDKEKPQTTAAYRYIKTLANYVITNTAVPSPKQNTVSQDTSGSPGGISEVGDAEALIDNIVNIINNGPSVAAAFVPISLTPSGDANNLNAAERLLANRDFIKAEVTAYIDDTVPFSHPFYSGDNITVRGVDGMPQINNGYVHVITAATNANPVRLTFDRGHTFADGTAMNLSDFNGITELNGRRVYAKYVSTTQVDLYQDPTLLNKVDGTGYGVYTSGGEARTDSHYYVRKVSNTELDLYADPALTKPISGTAGLQFGTATPNTGYVGAGYVFTSPYVHNCSSITSKGTGMRVDGSRAAGLRSMVLDSFTQLNEGGTGIEMINRGYAQLVSIFTICTDKSIVCKDGGFCSITNSNSSFGRLGLVADGVSEALYSGTSNGSEQTGRNIFLDELNDRPNYGDAMKVTSTLNISDLKIIGRSASVNDAGSGYAANELLTPSDVVGTAPVFKVTSVKVVGTPAVASGGTSGYTTGDRLIFSSGYSVPAILEVTASAGAITGLSIVNPGVKNTTGGTSASPDITTGNAVTVDLSFGVNTVDIDSFGDITVAPFNSAPTTSSGSGLGARLDVVYCIQTQFSSDHFFVGDERITVSSVGGMIQLNDKDYYVELTGEADVVYLHRDINLSTGVDVQEFDAYTSGGTVTVDDYFTVDSATDETGGTTSTVSLTRPVRRPLPDNTPVTFHQRSVISASSHTFEFIGSGNTLSTATPESGAFPIQANEIGQFNAGAVYFTSTDQVGDFRIGTELVINRDTGTISGRTFNKSLFAVLTPYILALEG